MRGSLFLGRGKGRRDHRLLLEAALPRVVAVHRACILRDRFPGAKAPCQDVVASAPRSHRVAGRLHRTDIRSRTQLRIQAPYRKKGPTEAEIAFSQEARHGNRPPTSRGNSAPTRAGVWIRPSRTRKRSAKILSQRGKDGSTSP